MSNNLIDVQQMKNVYNTEKQMIKLGLLNISSLSTSRHSRGSKHCSSILIKTSNRFSPLIDAPTEKPDDTSLVIEDSIVLNMKIETPATIVQCLPGATAPDI